ncbi:hypothetical protein EVAR_11918_1 [Eumeta japonica]|uniref:Uncharacterized protein n=1 Tax=Eumeta variegata TaxID=151549 RepID=A0A4C1U7P0_EUMVA|nr:hypothetical protein EVAR_11918_1 [Eumeta japonica]
MENLFSNVVLKKLNGDINAQARAVIHNVFLFLKELKTDPEKKACLNFDNPQELAALICGELRLAAESELKAGLKLWCGMRIRIKNLSGMETKARPDLRLTSIDTKDEKTHYMSMLMELRT